MRRIGVRDVGAFAPVSAEARIDQDLTNDPPIHPAPRMMRNGSGQITPRTVATEEDVALMLLGDGHESVPGVHEASRKDCFRGKAIIDRDDAMACAVADLGADVVMAVQAAQNKAAAVVVDNGDPAVLYRIGPARDAAIGAVLHRHACGARHPEISAHGVIGRAVICHRHAGGIRRIALIQPPDIGPHLRVDQTLIVCLAHAAFSQGRVKPPKAPSTSPSSAPFIATCATNPRFLSSMTLATRAAEPAFSNASS